MTDNILQRIAQGDESAIEECLSAYGGLVWSIAKKYCRVNSDAEDATQEIFVEIWKNADRFDPEISSETNFVSLIARRRLIDRVRRKSRAVETVAIAEELHPTETDLDQLEIADEIARAKACLERLKPDERKVIELSICQHYPQSKIAEMLDLPLGTVKTHARRGMVRLREMLGTSETSEVRS